MTRTEKIVSTIVVTAIIIGLGLVADRYAGNPIGDYFERKLVEAQQEQVDQLIEEITGEETSTVDAEDTVPGTITIEYDIAKTNEGWDVFVITTDEYGDIKRYLATVGAAQVGPGFDPHGTITIEEQ